MLWVRIPVLILGLASLYEVNADSGFYSTRSYRVPSSVEQASNSIVKILLTDPQTKRPLGWGTGFVAENSNTLWTAAHVLNGPLHSGMNLSVELYDVVGKKVFDTASSDTATLSYVGIEGFNEQSANEKDFARITLNRPLPMRPVTVNSKLPSLGDDLFVVGFPAIDSVQEANSSTYTQSIMQSRVTMGKNIKASQANEQLVASRSPAQVEKIDQALSEKMLFIDSDGYFGQSGAPIFNDSGEVVGIFTAIFRSQESGPGLHIRTRGLGPSFSGILSP